MATSKLQQQSVQSQHRSIIPFQFEAREIRVILGDDGEPLFVGKDAAELLEYVDTDKAIRTHCKYARLFKPADSAGLGLSPRGIMVIPESDLYRLIMKSQMPKAEEFQDWVMEEVLPSIRKTGTYSVPAAKPRLSLLASEARGAIAIAKAFGFTGNQAILSANTLMQKFHGQNLLESMEQTHLICEVQEKHLTATDLGKLLGNLSGQKVNQLLKESGLLESFRDHKDRLQWKPTETGKSFCVLKDTGKKHGNGTPVQAIFWLESVREKLNGL